MRTNLWKAGQIIRTRSTGKPYLVLHVYKDIATIVTDMEQPNQPLAIVLLERNYPDFAKDQDMKHREDTDTWEVEHVDL